MLHILFFMTVLNVSCNIGRLRKSGHRHRHKDDIIEEPMFWEPKHVQLLKEVTCLGTIGIQAAMESGQDTL